MSFLYQIAIRMIQDIQKELAEAGNSEKARHAARFFKTGKGEYAEGDKMLGITVPQQRVIARKYREMCLKDTAVLLKSEYHECRLTALLILVERFKKASDEERQKIYNLYLANTRHINNWDLVDLSAPNIVGVFLMERDRKPLYTLAKSRNLWEKRIAMLATFTFIRAGDFADALKIAEILLHDPHDLIHKAVGWMLREIGKRNQAAEEVFLKLHAATMPRTMLRYAIEKFDEKKRAFYMTQCAKNSAAVIGPSINRLKKT